jgi:hypothetical protein
VAEDAVSAELTQLFKEKKALVPVHVVDLTPEQKKNMIRSHMFITEKYASLRSMRMVSL